MTTNTKDTNKLVSGSVKEAIGKITGDAEVQAEGVAEKKGGVARAGSVEGNACQNSKD